MSVEPKGRQPGEQRDGPPGIPFGAIWSAFTSQHGAFTADLASSATEPTGSPPTSMTATAVVNVPISTVTVESTILQTAFVTVTTNLVQPYLESSSSSSSTSTSSTSRLSSSRTSAAQSTSSPRASLSTSQHATLPAVITNTIPSQTATESMKLSLQTHQPTPMGSTRATAGAAASTLRTSQKHAIVGGLSGAIGSLVFLGALLFFCLRRRRRRIEDDTSDAFHEPIDEKGIRPTIMRKWTELTGKGTPKPTPQLPPSSSPVTVDEDHHIIRMSTQHWMRPYALGQGEGYRESMPPGQLRVTNPDLSRPTTPRMSSDTAGSFLGRLHHLGPARPTTPRMSSDTAGSFLRKQRSALAAVLLTANHSRASSRSNIHEGPPQIPEIIVDPALSPECIAPAAATPSFRSYPSATSLPLVQQQPPEDPFVTPPDEKDEASAQQRPKRPGLAPLQSAAGAAGRTLSHLGSVLNPFRTKSSVIVSVRSSISTSSSRPSQRNTGFSDPFDLDKPSIRGSHGMQEHTVGDLEQGRTLYEGT